MNLMNITKENLDDPTLIYKISFGFICACLCLVTITGNLLVLVTFRRIRRVSIRKRYEYQKFRSKEIN